MILDGSDNLIDLDYPQPVVVESVEEFFVFEDGVAHLQGDGGSLCTLMPSYAQFMHNL